MIFDGVDRLGIAGVAEAGMIGNDHGVPRGPVARHFEAREGPGAVQEHERRSVSDGVDDRSHAVDVVFRAGESGQIGRERGGGIRHGRSLRLKTGEPRGGAG